MTTIVLLSGDAVLLDHLQGAFALHAPQLRVVVADDPAAAEAEVAACWYPPAGSLGRLPRLRLVHSVAAGVDHLGTDRSGPPVPVCRVVDPEHRRGMAEYVRWAVLYFHRDFDRAISQHRQQLWQRHPQRGAGEFTVGVMGLGSLGAAIAVDLAGAGYAVRGWARGAHQLPNVAGYQGDAEFKVFLQGLDLLVNVLPLTEQTRGILCANTFTPLAPGAAIVNVGRGQHLVAADLAQAVAQGRLRGAVLDVFDHEPLPASDPLWQLPGVLVTPHMASAASHACIARQVAENTRRLVAGEPLNHAVDPQRGY